MRLNGWQRVGIVLSIAWALGAGIYTRSADVERANNFARWLMTPRPVRNGRTVFTHAGKTETGRVEAVEPPDWDKTGAIPTIHVTLSPGK